MAATSSNLKSLFRTSAFQLTVLYASFFVISVLVLFAFLYWSTIGSLNRQIDATLDTEILGLAEQYERRGINGLVEIINQRVARNQDSRSIYLFADASLRPLAGNLRVWPAVPASSDGRIAFELAVAGASPVPVRAKILSVGRSFRLLVGRDVRELTALDKTFERSAAWGIAVVLLLAFSGGLLMSLGARRRIASINRTARRIIAGNFSERVPDAGSRDEYDDLALNINAMLDQIESLFDSVRHVGDSIAHDLKTPLTRLRNRLELLATSASPGVEEIQRCVAESDRLLNTFNALLRISRVESGAYRAAFREVDLGEIVSDACDLYRAAADERDISIDVDVTGPAQIHGDRELLAQAVANLLDNAVKYAPDGGRIGLTVSSSNGHCRIVVADNGDGVAPGDLHRIAQRFVRLDSSRSAPGNGLGLSLVSAVVEQHRGTLAFEDNQPGLKVTLELPRREPGADPAAS